jgi:uncharacterized repeat protein (TIGR03803 family)
MSVWRQIQPKNPTVAKGQRKNMSKEFDELAKRFEQSVIWRHALRKFGIGLTGVALVCGGVSIARADWTPPESSVTPPAVVTLDSFATSENGKQPSAPLVVGPDGVLYGVTQLGGTNGRGTLFRLEANGTFTKLHDINAANPSVPCPALVVGPDGALYGATPGGDHGGLFRLQTNGTFIGVGFLGIDGAVPAGPLAVSGNALYGSTLFGGSNDVGTLFRMQTSGFFTKVHDFNISDGYASPALTVGPDGALYGSTTYSLFRLGTNGSFAKLHGFNVTNGWEPWAPLVVGRDGALYGSTLWDEGTLFRVETDGTFTTLHDFNGFDGYQPYSALVVGPDGALYGSTFDGGTSGKGTLFRIETDGTFTKLQDFNGTNGSGPSAALVVGPGGALYGPTKYGGTDGYGTLFRLETNGTFTKLHDFSGTNDGANPSTALVMGSDGALYGSTPSGGSSGGGILFKLVLNRPPVARCHDVTVSAGANCEADASVDNGSFDPDAGDAITLRQEPPGPYPLGTNQVMLIVTDNHGASNSCKATVTVMDSTPPMIGDVSVSPNVLWPPNGKMVGVAVNYTASDDCGGVTNVLVVSSSEGSNGSSSDWVIEDEHHVQLRAERSGAGGGRLYTITVISTDNAGNSSTKSAVVTVPKSRGK